MSAGKFSNQFYVTDAGIVGFVSIQPETVTAWNPAGVGPPAAGAPTVRVSGGRNKIGIHARIARFRWSGTPAVAPTGYDPSGIITLPILTLGALTALVKGTSYAYLGASLNLVGKTSEKIR